MADEKASPETIVALMRANLLGVFNERSSEVRNATIKTTYAEDVVIYEPSNIAHGHAEIDRISSELLNKSPGWVFAPNGSVIISHNLGILRWHFGPEGQKPLVEGIDIAQIVGGKIKVLHVMIGGVSEAGEVAGM
ncbi:hypothetical protein BJ875DRAFT_474656 [Amylocarpus encephaloides]|uniref:SnoaL-like domain-containing protein n=1 Tax=Amylocarpus encephaloides TaxID=45428 RepID=A0A9P7Y9A5_9HELO|nr:hypothetical protein BJ875DRAFT_474656 [Amylocarpus encephaloides]